MKFIVCVKLTPDTEQLADVQPKDVGGADLGVTMVLNPWDEFAVEEALQRLRAGDYGLAIHPRCGTNFVASGILAGGAAWLATLGGGKGLRSKLDRLPIVMLVVTMAIILSQPLGPYLQQYVTTDAHIGDLQVVEIMQYQRNKVSIFRILTRG